jgi:hypothetical protein
MMIWLIPGAAGTQQVSHSEPRIVLALPAYGDVTFANFGAVAVPTPEVGLLQVIVSDARAELDISSIRMLLNNQPVSAFLTINPMVLGARVSVDFSRIANPAFKLRADGDNVLSFEALDRQRNRYFAQFLIRVQQDASRPQLLTDIRLPARKAFEPPPSYPAPRIRWISPATDVAQARTTVLEAEVLDEYGLRQVILEVNGKEIETVVLENGMPVRKRGGFRTPKRLPGTVEGDGRRLSISIPVELKKAINVLALRAENVRGMYASDGQTVRLKEAGR